MSNNKILQLIENHKYSKEIKGVGIMDCESIVYNKKNCYCAIREDFSSVIFDEKEILSNKNEKSTKNAPDFKESDFPSLTKTTLDLETKKEIMEKTNLQKEFSNIIIKESKINKSNIKQKKEEIDNHEKNVKNKDNNLLKEEKSENHEKNVKNKDNNFIKEVKEEKSIESIKEDKPNKVKTNSLKLNEENKNEIFDIFLDNKNNKQKSFTEIEDYSNKKINLDYKIGNESSNFVNELSLNVLLNKFLYDKDVSILEIQSIRKKSIINDINIFVSNTTLRLNLENENDNKKIFLYKPENNNLKWIYNFYKETTEFSLNFDKKLESALKLFLLDENKEVLQIFNFNSFNKKFLYPYIDSLLLIHRTKENSENQRYIAIIKPYPEKFKSLKKEDKIVTFGLTENDILNSKPYDISELKSFILRNELIDNHEKKIESILDTINNYQDNNTNENWSVLDPLYEKMDELELQKKEYLMVLENAKKKIKSNSNMNTGQCKSLELSIEREKQKLDSGLPIYAHKSKILEKLHEKRLLLLVGETGSGKSTQIPQFLLDDLLSSSDSRCIVCSEPRKLAVLTLAKRVSEEYKIPELIGYNTGSKEKVSKQTKLIFMTDRVLLNELAEDPLLKKYSTVIIDEAHERNVNSDILIGFMKKCLENRKDIKLIITSATLDEKLFKDYFKTDIVKVSGSLFPVKIKYKPYGENKDHIEEIEKILRKKLFEPYKNKKSIKEKYEGHVLVFTSGIDDIANLIYRCQYLIDPIKFALIPLHGKLTVEEQREAFSEVTNKTKIIFCTRIAETSITINNVKIVIDIGFDKENVYDPKKKMNIIQTNYITQSSAKQRAGRAGRTTQGICYRLYSLDKFKQMSLNKMPEIKKISLEMVVLRLKQHNIKDLASFEYLEKPDLDILKEAEETMMMIGALDEKTGQITQLGKVLSFLPTDPLISKIIIDSYFRYCNEDIINIISLLTCSEKLWQYITDEKKKEIKEFNRFGLCHPSGDFLTFRNIMNEYSKIIKYKKRDWCFYNTINYYTMRQAEELKREINNILRNNEHYLNKICPTNYDKNENLDSRITKCILSAFFQNICLYSGNPKLGYTLLNRNLNIKIYGTSVLNLQGIFPKWILCHDICRADYNYCKIASEVSLESLKECVPKKFLEKYNLLKFDKEPIYKSFFFEKVGTSIISSLKRGIETEVKEMYSEGVNEKDHIEFDQNNDRIEIWTLNNSDESTKAIRKCIENLKKRYLNEIEEENFIGETRIVLERGLTISKILLRNEYRTIYFENSRRSGSELIRFLKVNKVIAEIGKYQYDEYTETAKGNIIIANLYKYEQTVELLKILDKDLNIYNKSEKERNIKSRLKCTFFTGKTQNKGAIFFNSEEDLNVFYVYLNSLQIQDKGKILIDEKMVSFRIAANQKKFQIILNNLSDLTDEITLERFFNGDENTPKYKFFSIFRDSDFTDSIASEEYSLMIQNILKKNYNIDEKVQVTQDPYKNKNERIFFLNFNDHVKANEIKNILDQKLDFLPKNKKLNVESSFSRTFNYLNYSTFKILEETIYSKHQNLCKKLKNSIKMRILGEEDCKNKVKNYVTIRFETSDPFQLNYIVNSFSPVLLGKIIQFSDKDKIGFFRTKYGNNFLSDLKKNYYISIVYEQKYQRLKYFGNPDDFQTIQSKIQAELFNNVNSIRKISLKNIVIRPLLENDKRLWNKLLKDYNELFIDFSICYKEISVEGFEPTVNKFCGEINRILKINDKLDDKEIICGICSDYIQKGYRLLACGHRFCIGCLEELLRNAASDLNIFPLKCPQCQELLVLRDIKNIAEFEIPKLREQAFKKYINKYQNLYKFCPKIDCGQIMRIDKNLIFECDVCLKNYCKLCLKNEHPNLNCNEYDREIKDFEEEETLIRKFRYKRCKKCSIMLEKNGGCNHLECKNCGNHICWICSRDFTTASEVYSHINLDHDRRLYN